MADKDNQDPEFEAPEDSSSNRPHHVSRIPRLMRSASLRVKKPPTSLSLKDDEYDSEASVTMIRSASFISSRGMNGLLTPSPHSSLSSPLPPHLLYSSRPLSFPLTPELPRKRFSYVSPYSRSSIANERKNKDTNDPVGEDCDSVTSYESLCSSGSFMRSSRCHNGGGGVVHCGHNHETIPDLYLTPTQRAARTIRALKGRLALAEREISAKNGEINSLHRQLAKLRVNNSQCSNSGSHLADKSKADGKSDCISPDASEPELRELCDTKNNDVSNNETTELASRSPATDSIDTDSGEANSRSLADSGHYDDLTSPANSHRSEFGSKNSPKIGNKETICEEEQVVNSGHSPLSDSDQEEMQEEVEEMAPSGLEWRASIQRDIETRLQDAHMKDIERLRQEHLNEFHEMKERHNNKVETLLTKLSDANLRYFELRPQLDRFQTRIHQLESELERAKDDLTESERRHQSTYLQMFLKGQQAARLQHESETLNSASKELCSSEMGGGELVEGGAHLRGAEGTVAGLMRQLAHTQDELRKLKAAHKSELQKMEESGNFSNNGVRSAIDPAVTLQFLKSAVYYFLTDKDNAKGHLRAIISILGFNDAEKYTIIQVVKI